jgi:hypothetical protein
MVSAARQYKYSQTVRKRLPLIKKRILGISLLSVQFPLHEQFSFGIELMISVFDKLLNGLLDGARLKNIETIPQISFHQTFIQTVSPLLTTLYLQFLTYTRSL